MSKALEAAAGAASETWQRFNHGEPYTGVSALKLPRLFDEPRVKEEQMLLALKEESAP